MTAAYLLILIAFLAFPLANSRSVRFGFGPDLKIAWAAAALSAIPFVAWDIGFTSAGVRSFNPRYILGPSLFGLPLEVILFYLVIPFACLFIYQQFRRAQALREQGSSELGSRRRRRKGRFTAFWWALGLVLLVTAAMNTHRMYTLAVCLLGSAAATLLTLTKPRYSESLLAAAGVQLIPFLVVNSILMGLPVLTYERYAVLGFRIGTMPVEDMIYSVILMALPVALFEGLAAYRRKPP